MKSPAALGITAILLTVGLAVSASAEENTLK
jgi:hypothetical protein